jgi:protoheme IX farnesyltransferase
VIKEQIAAYYLLTKPGIVRGNAVHVVAGALLASVLPLDWKPLIGVLIGTSLVIASACVANNYMDRGIDVKMKRTRKRPSVTGLVRIRHAMIYAGLLLAGGFTVLIAMTNAIVVLIGVAAYVLYVFVYGWAKRRTVHSTLVGAIPGALPAMAGYVAVTGELTVGAWLVFMLIVAWQMPHFYAISLFRKPEYKSAGLPVLGVTHSFDVVRRHMLGYILVYLTVVALMIATWTVQPAAGILLTAGSAYWLYVFFRPSTNHVKWARSVFGSSLVLTLILLVASILNLFITPHP